MLISLYIIKMDNFYKNDGLLTLLTTHYLFRPFLVFEQLCGSRATIRAREGC